MLFSTLLRTALRRSCCFRCLYLCSSLESFRLMLRSLSTEGLCKQAIAPVGKKGGAGAPARVYTSVRGGGGGSLSLSSGEGAVGGAIDWRRGPMERRRRRVARCRWLWPCCRVLPLDESAGLAPQRALDGSGS